MPPILSFEVAHVAVFSSKNPTKYKPDAQASEWIGDVILAAKTSGSATISLACAAGLYQMRNFKNFISRHSYRHSRTNGQYPQREAAPFYDSFSISSLRKALTKNIRLL